jgi:hypothetical protein
MWKRGRGEIGWRRIDLFCTIPLIMKQFIFMLFCLFSLPVYCQVVAIQNDKQNFFYIGIDNPITVAAAGYRSSDISVTITDGTITGDHGRYVIRAEHPGNVTIEVRRKTTKGFKIITEMLFRVQRIPDPTPQFAGKTNGTIYGPLARAQIAPAARIVGFDFDAKFTIDSCTILVLRNSKPFFIRSLYNHNGVRFSDDKETQSMIQTLKGGDKLLFIDMTTRGPDNISRHIVPMEFTITDSQINSGDEKK